MVSHSPKEGTDVKHLFRFTELQHTVGSPALLTSTCHYREKEVEMSQPPPSPYLLMLVTSFSPENEAAFQRGLHRAHPSSCGAQV